MSGNDVLMPKLSEAMEDGVVASWLKVDGDRVAAGEALAEIETDKATMVYESPYAGVVETFVEVGEVVPIGAPIARINT